MRAELDARHRTQDIDYEGELLLLDAITSNPGAPGGAVVTVDGNLAGMIGKLISATSTKTFVNYAVPADQLKPFVQGRAEPEVSRPLPPPAGKPLVGIRLFKLSGPQAPPYIDQVAAKSPAAKTGLKPDDLVLAINGHVVRSVRDCEAELAKLRPGEEMTVVYKRKDQVLSAQVKVERSDGP